MVTDARGHEVPADSDMWGYREDMGLLSSSIADVRPVANQAAAEAAVADLDAGGVDPEGTLWWFASPGGWYAYRDGEFEALPAAGDLDGRLITYLPDNSQAATDGPDKYPDGLSVMTTTTAGWPTTSGLVVTQRYSAARVQQFFYSSLSRAYYRSGSSASWSAWTGAASPYGEAAGTSTIANVGGGATKNVTVSLPANTFSSAPFITLGVYSSSTSGRFASHINKSATSFTMCAYNAWDSATDIYVSWNAVQMSRDSPAVLQAPARSLRTMAADPGPDATITCTTAGCTNEGIPIPVTTSWIDEEGTTQTVDEYVCGVCNADITDTLTPIGGS